MSSKLIFIGLLKGLLTFIFGEMRRVGMSDEEINELYNATRAEFLANDPANIPEV